MKPIQSGAIVWLLITTFSPILPGALAAENPKCLDYPPADMCMPRGDLLSIAFDARGDRRAAPLENNTSPFSPSRVGADIPAAGSAPPFVVETDAAYTVAFGDQFYGAVAAGPGEYFGVWVDLRVSGASGGGYNLYAQRILPEGTVGAPGSIELLRDDSRMTTGVPAVAWNGQVYLVVWYEFQMLWGMRVGPQGEVLDPGGFVIGNRPNPFIWPSIASDGQNFLVVEVSNSRVLATRVGGDGSILDEQPLVLMPAGASGLGFPKVAYGVAETALGAGEYMVVWAQAPNQSIRGCRVLSDGAVLDFGGFNISGGPAADVDAHIDFDGTRFYVVWLRQSGQVYDLWGTHVLSGGLPGTPRFLVNGNSLPGGLGTSQLAFNGSRHLVALTTGEPIYSTRDLHAQLIDISGSPIGGTFPVATIPGFSQVSYGVASVGSQFFILWERNRLPYIFFVYDTEGGRITNDGVVLDRPEPIYVSTTAAWQINSSTSFDGSNFLSVFEDWREGADGPNYGPDYEPDLYAVRVTPQGHPVDSTAFRVAGGFERAQQQPDAAFGGGQHVIVYENKSATYLNEVRMVRVRPDGTVLDPNPILVFANEPTGDTYRPKVAWNGQKYCVVWYDSYIPAPPTQKPLQFALMRTDGTRDLGPLNIPGSDDADSLAHEIASNGSEFLVVWSGLDRIYATRIGNSGAILGTQTVQFTADWYTAEPRVAFNGQSYLTAWVQGGDDGDTIYARRLGANGTTLGPTIVVAGPSPRAATGEVLVSGTDFVLIGWQSSSDTGAGTGETFKQRIDAQGNLVGAREPIFTGPTRESYGGSSFASGTCGRAMATMSLWAGMPYNGPRAQGMTFAIGSSCPGDADADGDVDAVDFAAYLDCVTGPDAGAIPLGCLTFDADDDEDVDLADLASFLLAFTGP